MLLKQAIRFKDRMFCKACYGNEYFEKKLWVFSFCLFIFL